MGTSLQVSQQKLKDLLVKAQPSFASVLPKHMHAERLVKLALLAATRTPKLYECTPASVLNSLMTAAQLGLEPNGVLGSAYLVPYKRHGVMQCELIPGYRGLVDLARRSGEIIGVEARVVYKGDKFTVHYGTSSRIEHEPAFTVERTFSAIVGFYAVAQLRADVKQFEFMTQAEVMAIRQRSKAADDGPWVTDYEEMGKKTATKRLVKYLPLSSEMATAIEIDNRVESGDIGGLTDLDTQDSVQAQVMERTQERAAKLAEKMGRPVDAEMEAELRRQDAEDVAGFAAA